jgi:hypothetical protein
MRAPHLTKNNRFAIMIPKGGRSAKTEGDGYEFIAKQQL